MSAMSEMSEAIREAETILIAHAAFDQLHAVRNRITRAERLEQALVDLHESLFIASERGASSESLRAMASFAKKAVTDD